MVVHFKAKQRTLIQTGHQPVGSGGSVATAEAAIEHRQAAQCGCGGGQSSAQPKLSLAQFAQKVQADPLLLRKLGRRVYELMQADLDLQRERNWNYGARR
ncbi:MAG: hypothetical protein AAGG51_29455 [Cyanobacteria bacterium P01_G01_bin.54]